MATFGTIDEALAIVREAVAFYGDSYADDLVLNQEPDESSTFHLMAPLYAAGPKRVAEGRKLVALARAKDQRKGHHR